MQDLEDSAGVATAASGMTAEFTAVGVDIRVFTTRPDTIFGATYLVLAPEHPLAESLTSDEQRAAVTAYRERASRQDLVARKVSKEKTGVFTGSFAINPATTAPIPIWIADYVLMEYGTGAIMGVPGHDERDFEFATAFSLPIVRVVASSSDPAHRDRSPLTEAYTETDGVHLANSGKFNGLGIAEGKRAITEQLEKLGHARPVVNYRLHDWCISRQRYWGPPIPIIYCDKCGTVPVPEKDLAGRAAVRRGLQARRHGRVAAGARRSMVSRALSEMRRRRASRDRRLRHLPRQLVVFPALSEHRVRRSPVRRRAHEEVAAGGFVHRRQRARRAAPAVFALHHDGAPRREAGRFRGAVHEVPRPRDDHP